MTDEPQRPIGDNRHDWKAYWMAMVTPWRTEPKLTQIGRSF